VNGVLYSVAASWCFVFGDLVIADYDAGCHSAIFHASIRG
jgi:hypothetical protein